MIQTHISNCLLIKKGLKINVNHNLTLVGFNNQYLKTSENISFCTVVFILRVRNKIEIDLYPNQIYSVSIQAFVGSPRTNSLWVKVVIWLRVVHNKSNEVKHCVSTPQPFKSTILAASHMKSLHCSTSPFVYVAAMCLERLNVCDCESSEHMPNCVCIACIVNGLFLYT